MAYIADEFLAHLKMLLTLLRTVEEKLYQLKQKIVLKLPFCEIKFFFKFFEKKINKNNKNKPMFMNNENTDPYTK